MNTASLPSPIRQRYPCAGLFLAAVAGIILSRTVDTPFPSIWIILGVSSALVSLMPQFHAMLWLAVACTFGALQESQFQSSPGARLLELATQSEPSTPAREWILRVDDAPRLSGSHETGRWLAIGAVREPGADATGVGIWMPVQMVWRGSTAPAYGDHLRVMGSIAPVQGPRNPAAFDAPAWLALRGIFAKFSVDSRDPWTLIKSSPNPIVEFAINSRANVTQILSIGIGGTVESSLILGMTLGETGDAPETITDAFREAGVFHLFSVSGLHVGMIAGMLWFLLGICGVSQRHAAWILIPCVFFYALLTGWKPAGVRAATMITFIAAGMIFSRQPIAINSLCAAGLLLLGINSNELFNPGFQLSFLVVGAIILLAVPLVRLMEQLLAPDPFLPRLLISKWRLRAVEAGMWLSGSASVSLAAWVGSLPLIIWYFNLVSPAALIANLFIVPLAFVSLALAAGSISTGWLVPLLADILNHANFLITKIIMILVSWIVAIPGGHFYVAQPMPNGTVAEVTVMDFDSGGASVVRTHDGVWLLDGGDKYNGETTLIRFLRSIGTNSLAGVILSHGDADHLGGIAALENRIPVRTFFESASEDRSPTRKHVREMLVQSGVERRVVTAFDSIPAASGVTWNVLFPPPGFLHPKADEKCLVLRLDVRGFRILFLNDAGVETERWLLQNARDAISADMIVKGHPTDGDSGSEEFLSTVAPRVIIQAAAIHRAGGGISTTLRVNAKALDIPLLLQNETGAIVLNIEDRQLELREFLTGKTMTLELRNPNEPSAR